ncbi:MAG: hypothetical protein FJY99_04445 [Candidatus Sericytochromatia bacterium]|nr:hypothetical protein [Candidatus Tanganyikabacteria bacterium]
MPDQKRTFRPGVPFVVLLVGLMVGMAGLQALQLATEAAKGSGDLAWWDYLLRRMGQYKPALFKPPANGLLLGACLLGTLVTAGLFATHGLRQTTDVAGDPDLA